MNFTESFNQFSSRLGPMDIALYAGAGIILWVLFKDKLSPIQSLLLDFINKTKKNISDVNEVKSAFIPSTPSSIVENIKPLNQDDLFFQLIMSWKQTRDLAVKSGCSEAIKVADQMFPFLSPNVCSKKEVS